MADDVPDGRERLILLGPRLQLDGDDVRCSILNDTRHNVERSDTGTHLGDELFAKKASVHLQCVQINHKSVVFNGLAEGAAIHRADHAELLHVCPVCRPPGRPSGIDSDLDHLRANHDDVCHALGFLDGTHDRLDLVLEAHCSDPDADVALSFIVKDRFLIKMCLHICSLVLTIQSGC